MQSPPNSDALPIKLNPNRSFLLPFGRKFSPQEEEIFLIQFLNRIEEESIFTAQKIRVLISAGRISYESGVEANLDNILNRIEEMRRELRNIFQQGFALVGRALWSEGSGIEEGEEGNTLIIKKNSPLAAINTEYPGANLKLLGGSGETLIFAKMEKEPPEALDLEVE